MADKFFQWTPVKRLIKDAGAEMVAKDAVNYMIDHLTEHAKEIVDKGLEVMRHSNRKKLSQEDIQIAIREM